MKSCAARVLSVVAACAMLLALLPATGLAQTGSAVVKGSVFDASQALIPNAKVTLTNLDTNIVKVAETSELGTYYFPANQPGRYSVTVDRQGFMKWTGSLVLEVGQTAVVDAHMEVGASTTAIEVSGAAPIITTEGSSIADVKDDTRIHQIPLNGRTLQTLFDMVPGVEQAGSGENGARVNGMKVGSGEMTVDGVSIQDRYSGDVVQIQPGLDTVQEFRTETTGSSARYARPSTVTVVTKSGTNELHGSLFDTHRNNSGGLVARRRENMTDSSPELIRNEFGGSVGGPVYIPKVYNGKNKTFFFFSYEGLRQHQQQLADGTVPTEAMWGGDFSQAINASGQRYTIYDPMTTNAAGIRLPFANNTIPTSRIGDFSKTLRSITHPATNSLNPYMGQNNIDLNYPVLTDTNTYSIKLDHHFSDKDTISGRFTNGHRNFDETGGDPGTGFAAQGVNNAFGTYLRDNRDKNGNVTYTHLFTTNLFSELLLGVNRSTNHTGTAADFTNWDQKLGIANPFGADGWPTIDVNYSGFNTIWDIENPKTQNMTSFTAEENMTWVHGKHTVQFGGRLRHELNNINQTQQPQGSHEFDNDWTGLYNPGSDSAVPFTGDGFAGLLLGTPSYLSAQYNRGFFYFRQTEVGLYVTDSYKITPKLTLDYGLRWDKWTPYSEKQDRLLNLDVANIATQFQVVTPAGHPMESLPGIPASVLAAYTARGLTWTTADKVPGMPSGLLPSNNSDFAPRVGIAYRLDDKTTIRGGYGEYYWSTPLSLLLSQARTDVPLNLRFTNVPSYDEATGSYSVGLRTVPTQFMGPNLNIASATVSNQSQPFFGWDYNKWNDGRARTWNFTIERELFKDTALRVSYLGNQGRNLEQRYDLNQREGWYNYVVRTGQARPGNTDLLRANSNWNPFAINKTGYSNTNMAEVNLERRFAKGVAFQVFYTFTRSLTTADDDAGSGGGGNINGDARGFSVPQSNEILGEPNMTYAQLQRLGYENNPSVPAHRVRWNGVLDLPFGRGRHFGGNMSKALDAVVGGWSFTPAGSWRSGLYLSITDDGNGDTLLETANPLLSADQRLTMTVGGVPYRLWFKGSFDPTQAKNVDMTKLLQLIPADPNQQVLRFPGPAGSGGWVPITLKNGGTSWAPLMAESYWGMTSPNQRAFIVGPGFWTADLGMNKTFSIKERMKLQIKADAFNFLNHPCDINPNTYTGLQDLSQQANDPRTFQFTARMTF